MSFTEYLDEVLGEHKDIQIEKVYHCPFCDDGRAYKFYVKTSNDTKDGLWHCKKCDKRGNPVSFIMQYNNYTFSEAKELLSLYDYEITQIEQQAKDAGLSVEEQLILFMGTLKHKTEEVKVTLVPPPLPVGYRRDWDHPDALPFIDYLINRRHVSWDDVLLHNMGFITDGYILNTQGKPVNLSNHVVFLTHDNEGRYQYWNTRSIEPDPFIKTFNCPAKDHEFSKRTTVFNLNSAKFSENLFLVEGVFDALTLGRGGIATFGKQVTHEQVDLILNSITEQQRLFIMLDMDAKTQMADLAKTIYARHPNTYIVINPTGKDANDLGRERVFEIINNHAVLADDRGQMLVLLG